NVIENKSYRCYEAICVAMSVVANGELKGSVIVTPMQDVVSMDFNGDRSSSIFDGHGGLKLNSNFFKVVSWYDNEWGYSNRMLDLMKVMQAKEAKVMATV
ncbi:similar to Glyceraldehyde-3-phosphate dehydrogenase/erythrose-4-phosphate dehydrogenase, partial [Crocosphaera watsonii WH 8501]